MAPENSKRKRPEPSARGNLEKSPLAHLLAYGYERQLNGSIELTTPDGRTADIVLADGYIGKVRTSEPVAYLGRVLLELGYVNNATLEHFSRRGDLHGELLLDAGEVNDKQLNYALKVQLVRKIGHMFTLPPETAFLFLKEFNVLHDYGGHFFHSTHPFYVIWLGACESPPSDHVKATLGHFRHSRMRLVKDAKLFRFQFPADVQRVVDALRGLSFTLADIAAAGLAPRSAQALAYSLLITKQLEVDDGTAAPMRPPMPSTSGEHDTRPARAEDRSGPAHEPPPAAATKAAPARPAPERTPPERQAPEPHAERASLRANAHGEPGSEFAEFADGDGGGVPLELDMSGTKTGLPVGLRAPKSAPRVATATRKGGATSAGPLAEPRGPFELAEHAARHNDLAGADAICRKALASEPNNAGYVALLAWVDSRRPERQSAKGVQECIAAIDRAIAINDRCAEAFYYRGLLFKRLKDHARALRDIRHAAELDPGHAGAIEQIRKYAEQTQQR